MSGSLIALSAKGAQDVHLTYKPQKTFWKHCHKRHTNFSIENLQGQFNGQIRLGGKLIHRVQRNSDLLSRTYVVLEFLKIADQRGTAGGVGGSGYRQIEGDAIAAGGLTVEPVLDLGDGIRFIDNVGFMALEECRVLIGGHEIDKYVNYDAIIEEDLCFQERRRMGELVGAYATDADAIQASQAFQLSGASQGDPLAQGILPTDRIRFYVPLMFWYSRVQREQAIPMIGLQYHEVQLEFRIRRADELIKFVYNQDTQSPSVRDVSCTSTDNASHPQSINRGAVAGPQGGWLGGTLEDAFLIYDGVFLDTTERKAFSCRCLEYLIQQHQQQDASPAAGFTNNSVELNFNHPVSQVHYFWRLVCAELLGNYTDWSGYRNPPRRTLIDILGDSTSGASLTLQLNGQNLYQPLDPIWHRLIQTKDHGGYKPDLFFYTVPLALDINRGESATDYLRPKYPTGSVNFSRIDRVTVNSVADGVANSNIVFNTATNQRQDATGPLYFHAMVKNYNIMKIASGMAGLYFAN